MNFYKIFKNRGAPDQTRRPGQLLLDPEDGSGPQTSAVHHITLRGGDWLSPNVRKAADEGVHVGARGVQSLWGCSGRDLQSRHHRDATVRAEPVQRHQLTASTESRPVSPHTVPSDTSSLPVQSRDPLDPTRSRSALPPPQRQGDKAMFYNRPTVQLTSLTVSCDLQY